MKTLHKIFYVSTLLYCIYRAVEQMTVIYDYPSLLGLSKDVFGYPISLGWTYLILVYWLVWIAGITAVLMSKPTGWILLMPVSAMGFVFAGISVLRESGNDLIFYSLHLAATVGFMILINQKTTFEILRISSKRTYYVIAAVIFLLFSCLFLFTDKHM
jgi:hypothetical protein